MIYEYKGYEFLFKGDEEVKERYIKNYEHFSNILGFEFPTTNITYINAKGLASGKTLDKFSQAENDYLQENYQKNAKSTFHKSTVFDNMGEKSHSISSYIKKLNMYFEDKEKAKTKDNKIRYNMIYYSGKY